MRRGLLAAALASLAFAAPGLAQTAAGPDDAAASAPQGVDWSGGLGEALFLDPELTTPRPPQELQSNWPTLSPEQQGQVLGYCERTQAFAAGVGGSDAEGVEDERTAGPTGDVPGQVGVDQVAEEGAVGGSSLTANGGAAGQGGDAAGSSAAGAETAAERQPERQKMAQICDVVQRM